MGYIVSMSDHLTPMMVLERLFGRPEHIARIAAVHPKAPYQWRRASSTRRAGDLPSAAVQRIFLRRARAEGLDLDPVWLIEGAPAAAVEALLAERPAPHEAA
jgi:hypothetical protein